MGRIDQLVRQWLCLCQYDVNMHKGLELLG